jgi:hypothetical protein
MPAGDPVSDLTASVDGLLALDTATFGDAELGGALLEVRRQRARLSAVDARWSRTLERRRHRRDEGRGPP